MSFEDAIKQFEQGLARKREVVAANLAWQLWHLPEHRQTDVLRAFVLRLAENGMSENHIAVLGKAMAKYFRTFMEHDYDRD
jgi:hypothetical protein